MAKQRFSYSYDLVNTGGYEWPYLLDYILPQLEENNFFQAVGGPGFDVMNPWFSPSTWPTVVNGVPISTFLCPSDLPLGQMKNLPEFSPPGSFVMCPATNYLGIFSGVSDWQNYKLTGNGDPATDGSPGANPNPNQRAVFGYYAGIRLSKIEDGTSNTMALAEYLTGIDGNDIRGAFITNRRDANSST